MLKGFSDTVIRECVRSGYKFNYYLLFSLNGRAEKNLRIVLRAILTVIARFLVELYGGIAYRVDGDRSGQTARRNWRRGHEALSERLSPTNFYIGNIRAVT